MAALAAQALHPSVAARTVDVVSEGIVLVVDAGDVALSLAESLTDALSVTVLATDGADAPMRRDVDMVRGRLKRVYGALGGFTVEIDGLQQVIPSGRGAFGWTAPRDGGRSEYDIVIDLTGATLCSGSGKARRLFAGRSKGSDRCGAVDHRSGPTGRDL